MTTIDLRRADRRYPTDLGWLESHHAFSFGSHYDSKNTGHGLLIVHNDDRVAPGRGFTPHSHRDMEIVSWVLDGSLEHRDSEGNHGVIYPGLAQRMSAGSGITHSEMNASATEPVHFLQMWVVPDTNGIPPGYEEADLNEALAAGGLVPVASGRGDEGAIAIHQADAVMSVARLEAEASVDVPDAPFVHLYVARGLVTFGDDTLAAGDSVRLRDAGVRSVTGVEPAEIVVWESHRDRP